MVGPTRPLPASGSAKGLAWAAVRGKCKGGEWKERGKRSGKYKRSGESGGIDVYGKRKWISRPVLRILHRAENKGLKSQHRLHTILIVKHHKNCRCCPVSLLIVRSQRLS